MPLSLFGDLVGLPRNLGVSFNLGKQPGSECFLEGVFWLTAPATDGSLVEEVDLLSLNFHGGRLGCHNSIRINGAEFLGKELNLTKTKLFLHSLELGQKFAHHLDVVFWSLVPELDAGSTAEEDFLALELDDFLLVGFVFDHDRAQLVFGKGQGAENKGNEGEYAEAIVFHHSFKD